MPVFYSPNGTPEVFDEKPPGYFNTKEEWELFYYKVIQKLDNSFVIVKNGLPYQVPNNATYKQEYDKIKVFISANPSALVQDEVYYIPSTQQLLMLSSRQPIPNDKILLTWSYYDEIMQGFKDGKILNPPDETHKAPWLSDPPVVIPPPTAEDALAILNAILGIKE